MDHPIQEIRKELKLISAAHGVDILFAAESGSRAWGFDSKDSDWDIRFIYKHPPAWYLSIDTGHDVIEAMDKTRNFDFVGWELRKALQLLRKSNPELFGWLNSPSIYIESEVYHKIHKVSRHYFNARAACHHYLHMAEGNFKKYIKDQPAPKHKKYLYVLLPLLCCYHIQKTAFEPPVKFDTLLMDVPKDFPTYEVSVLLAHKRLGTEMGEGPPMLQITQWCERMIAYYKETVGTFPTVVMGTHILNNILFDSVFEDWLSKA